MNRIFAVLLVLFSLSATSQKRSFKIHTIAFYNTENLFDTINDSGYGDDEFLPKGSYAWTGEKYRAKLSNIARVLADIGRDENTEAPTIIGLAELENRRVLEDLLKQQSLIEKGYGIVHFDSRDSRGTDVGLLYRKASFRPTSYKNIPLIIKDSLPADKKLVKGKKKKPAPALFTRDQLLVSGMLENDEIHFIVNHWPSRYGGEKKSSPLREAAAALNRKIIDSLTGINPNAKIVTMGDFNDGPYNNSITKVLNAKRFKDNLKPGDLFNPMDAISREGKGTVAYNNAWDLFDQIIITPSLVSKDYTSFRYWKAGIFDKVYLCEPTGKYRGYPLRNRYGEAGFSDHFPVYMYLIKEIVK
ncbi:endonuclease [Flavobacterium psychrophilum]|nr:endonuclease [Flavobacterium psychrophilum]AOE52897.1 endonuclease [Flavobacterium psychrophilum]